MLVVSTKTGEDQGSACAHTYLKVSLKGELRQTVQEDTWQIIFLGEFASSLALSHRVKIHGMDP